MHPCRATDCKQLVHDRLLMCRRHWYLVPQELRYEIWRTYKPDEWDDQNLLREYRLAVVRAIETVAIQEGKSTDNIFSQALLRKSNETRNTD